MTLILFFAVAVLLLIVPVKIAANYVKAGRTSIGACIFSVIVAAVLNQALSFAIPNKWLVFILFIALSPFVYMFILDTDYKKGLIISIVQGVLTAVIALLVIAVLGWHS